MAILAVACGHYFPKTPLWVIAEVALVIFAFSSGYFTALRYAGHYDFGGFWRSKMSRLGVPLLVINVFLVILFIVVQRPGILSLHTPLALVGMSGLYDWLGIHNQSAFGNGLWFFTVLILFYFTYPLLAKLFVSRSLAWAALGASAALCVLGERFASPNYALWQVIFGFIFGVFAGRQGWFPPRRATASVFLVLFFAALALNALHLKQLNPGLFDSLSIASVAILLSFRLPLWATAWTKPLAGCVLEIYFIHTYLFLPHALLGPASGFILSMLLIIASAWLLHRVSSAMLRQRSERTIASGLGSRESK